MRAKAHFSSTRAEYDPSCSSTQLDHIILLVGYGTQVKNQDFYWAKNSWGASWGENGYIQLARNRDNNCGVASYASYAIV